MSGREKTVALLGAILAREYPDATTYGCAVACGFIMEAAALARGPAFVGRVDSVMREVTEKRGIAMGHCIKVHDGEMALCVEFASGMQMTITRGES